MELANVEIKEKEIGENVYFVRPFPPQKSLELLGDLQAVVTSSLDTAVDKKDDIESNTEEESVLDRNINIGAIISGVGKNLKGPVLVNFANRIINKDFISIKRPSDETPVKLEKNISDNIFAGRLKEMIQLMYFVLEVNYADFFENELCCHLTEFFLRMGNGRDPDRTALADQRVVVSGDGDVF